MLVTSEAGISPLLIKLGEYVMKEVEEGKAWDFRYCVQDKSRNVSISPCSIYHYSCTSLRAGFLHH